MSEKHSKIDALTRHQTIRWILSFAALSFAWMVTPFSIVDRKPVSANLDISEQDAVMSLERLTHRYDFVPQGQERPICPGPQCPLSPDVDPTKLKYHRGVESVFTRLMTSEGWRGTMFLRWDLRVPGFVSEPNQPIAFDFYGVAGKSWRLMINGNLVASGRGGPQLAPVNFPAPGVAGMPLTIGMEIDVGRSLAPGLILSGQAFLSRPSIAPHLRLAYRGIEKESMIPLAIGYTILGLLAALSCFLTPFYKEILAFSLWVSVLNWRVLLINDMVPYPSLFNVDFVTFGAMLSAASLACQWAFYGFFFRMRKKIVWLPALIYGSLLPLLWVHGRLGFGLNTLILMHDTYEYQLMLAYLVGGVLAFHVSWITRDKVWARFRTVVSALIGVMSFVAAMAYMAMFAMRIWGKSESLLTENIRVMELAMYAPRAFIISIAFAMALEWALIVRDRQRVLQRFGTVVDPRLVNDIIRGPEGQSRRVEHAVILFSDLRAFSKMCEVFPPDQVMKALNDYLDVVTNAVQSHGGVVDKFVGDAVMALWGVPEVGENDSYAAVLAAMDIRLGMSKLNEKRRELGEFTLNVGVGVHGGQTIFGAVGNGTRVDHTVIGPTINIASRLEGVTKEYHCDIVISHSVLEKVESLVLVEDLGNITIRGMTSQVGAAKLIGIQLKDGDFVIGDACLQESVNLRRPGRVSGVPGNVQLTEYSDNTNFHDADHIAA